MHQLILASGSSARLTQLRLAGLDPQTIVSGVEENPLPGETALELTCRLAQLKARTVADHVEMNGPMIIIGCDSVLQMEGRIHGKPGSIERVKRWWHQMRRQSGMLVTGHHVIVRDDRGERSATRAASTALTFADLTDEEIDAYAETGQATQVAGGVMMDGLGAPFITRIVGDPHNVTGISLPLLRQIFLDLDVPWQSLWQGTKA